MTVIKCNHMDTFQVSIFILVRGKMTAQTVAMTISSSNQHKDALPLISEVYGDIQRFTNIFRLLITLIVVGLIAGIFIVLTTDNVFAAIVLATGLIPSIAAFYLIHHSKFEWAAVLLATILMSLNTILATRGLGIHHISNLAYPAILIIASLVTSKRTMALLTLFALGCIAWLVFGELSNTYTPDVLVRSVPGDFLSAAAILVITAFMIRLLTETLFQSNLRLQNELKERKMAEENYRNIFENAMDGFFQSTPDGRFVTVNPAMARIYGYDSPEDMTQNVSNIGSQIYVDPELRKVLSRRMAEDDKITGFESQEYRKDGSKIWTYMNARAIRDAKGNILFYEGIVEDITFRKEMELQRKEAETLYRTLVEQTSIVVYRDRPDEIGSALYISPQIETLLGYSVEEWLSEPTFWKKVVHPQDLPKVLADIKSHVLGKIKSSIEYRMQTKDGNWRWVRDETVLVKEEAGNALFVQGVLIDITERKQAETGLLQFRKLMDQSNDAIFLVDPQTSLYIDFNTSAYEKLGYSREELGHLGVIDIAKHITSMKIWEERVALVGANQNGLVFESVYKRKNGTTFPVEVSARMLDYQDQAIMVAIVRDITQRKHAEAALRESEERFRKIFSSSPIAICITTMEEGRLLDANNAYWDITGYSPETSIGRNAEELKMWDNPQERVEFVRDLREKHSISNPDDYFFHTDGSLKKVISFYESILIGEQECILSMFYDMSVQKQLETERENLIHQLETQNAESETLRESFASIVGTFEFEQIIEKILDQIAHVVPYDSSSVWTVDGNLQKLVASRNLPVEHIIEEMEIKVDEINSAFPILRGEVPYVLNNNVQEELLDFKDPPHNIINSWLAIPLKARGKIIGLIALDSHSKNQFNEHHARLAVTFANQVAIALENSQLFGELQNELFTREKLIKELESKNAELERFTYTVSHDLKSPLVTINGFMGYLENDMGAGKTERVKIDIARIKDAVDKMHLLLKELLELSRIGRIVNAPEEILFDDLVQDALELVHGRLAANGVTVHTNPNLPAIYGDRQRLIEVLQNLIDNAAKYIGDQPNPTIEIGQQGEDAQSGQLVFFVKDNGIGISPEYHERIFGLFDKLDSKSEGTGVGLALVKRILEVHEGKIWVKSEAGKGSTFYFTLPRNHNAM